MSEIHNQHGLPRTCLPTWKVEDLPEPRRLRWWNLASFIGPGIVMCGIQIGGGEWLLGPEITARYGGELMWIATIAIVGQVFYNLECGRYALYTGEPVFTGFMRHKPGPHFWIGVFALLAVGAFIPALSSSAAAVLLALIIGEVPSGDHKILLYAFSYGFMLLVALPILVGGKIYNTIEKVMATKVFVVLGFCLIVGVLLVSAENWGKVFGGFLKFGNVPVVVAADTNSNGLVDAGEDWDGDNVENIFVSLAENGTFPTMTLATIAIIGAFAGYAGGGGLSNSTYSNYVRDKGWGMGERVGAIPSAVGGRKITLSHIGSVFPLTPGNLDRWKLWWRYILTDQILVWGPGCFMGMALPGLLSIEFAQYSTLYQASEGLDWAQALITADGMRHAPAAMTGGHPMLLFSLTCIVGLFVLLPSQMSILENVCRRWTDVIWSGIGRVRQNMRPDEVGKIYYRIMIVYLVWQFIMCTFFLYFSNARGMVIVVANANNISLGATSLLLLYTNLRLLPHELRPRWFNILGLGMCAIFYLGLAALVTFQNPITLCYFLFFILWAVLWRIFIAPKSNPASSPTDSENEYGNN
jgi:hypothetical protein